jgi:Xaa-Pro aminopeptidase
VSEREIQIELEAGFFRAGGDDTAYESIVASGPRSAILHSPATSRRLAKGEMLLIDAGASVRRYASDVTRTYPANGFDAFQKDLYAVVLRAEERAIAGCKPGAEWRDLHLASARDMVEGLVSLGIMKGSPDSLVERSAHTLFFPHGLGHLVGLGIRDASGRLPGDHRERPEMLSTLRTDLPLGLDYVITVEPGLYFVPALLENRARREKFRDAVNWERADALKEFGGIRIEDNVRITPEGCEVLTAAIPK